MNKTTTRVSFLVAACVAVFMSVFLAVASVPFIGSMMGQLYPVSTKLQVTSIANQSDGAIIIGGTAQKLRECNFHHVEWFIGKRGGRASSVAAKFFDKAQVRPTGEMTFSGLRLAISQAQLSSSYGNVYHDCGWPWLRVTHFYDGSEE